jgi:hypothetical protein
MTKAKVTQDQFLAWSRYLSWADLNWQRLDDYFRTEGDEHPPGSTGRFVTHMSRWFASLWVVVEGWHALAMRDDVVTSLLRHPRGHSDLLRSCRNGVYHFAPDLIEPRTAELVAARRSALAWCHALQTEFLRVFWHYPEANGLDHEQAREWREAAFEVLGWLPNDCIYARITGSEQTLRETERDVPASDHSPEAEALRKALEILRLAITELRLQCHNSQQRYRDASWLDSALS